LISDSRHVHHFDPVHVLHTGRPGHPPKIPDLHFLENAMDPKRKITLTKLAKSMGLHRNTLRYYLKEYDVDYSFHNLSDNDLDLLVQTFRKAKPSSGLSYLVGFLRSHGLRIQRERVRSSVHRVDPVGSALRSRTIIPHAEYYVPRPNALWHMDGHHKLICWGIVVHGVIDGYCRTVSIYYVCSLAWTEKYLLVQMVALRARTNNRATTVLDIFLDAIEQWGLPSRVRGDRGGENRAVSIFMIMMRGLNRASYMWGSYVCSVVLCLVANI
jgi:hypothetical protein